MLKTRTSYSSAATLDIAEPNITLSPDDLTPELLYKHFSNGHLNVQVLDNNGKVVEKKGYCWILAFSIIGGDLRVDARMLKTVNLDDEHQEWTNVSKEPAEHFFQTIARIGLQVRYLQTDRTDRSVFEIMHIVGPTAHYTFYNVHKAPPFPVK
jgi:hypothetical protein